MVQADAARPGCTPVVDPTSGNLILRCLSPISSQWPFVRAVGVLSDPVTTATLDNPAPGKLCMRGVLANGGNDGANWGAIMGLNFFSWNQDQTAVLGKLDAQSLGIVQVQFTLESPPAIGVGVGLNMVTHTECPESTAYCSEGGRLRLMSGDSPFAYKTSGVKGPLPLSAFTQPPWDNSTLALDTSRLYSISFIVGTNPGEPLDYDFCISELKWLDAYGTEVIDSEVVDGGSPT